MSARDMRTLLLEYRSSSEERGADAVQFPLANIPGHSYTIGTLYPGDVKGEEFLFCRGEKSGLISPSHCIIRVDDQGQYWIQNDGGGKSTISFYDTFVNSVRVKGSESRLLKTGDIISLGAPGTDWNRNGNGRERPPHPIYRVKGRATLSSDLQIEVVAKNVEGVELKGGPKDDDAESPFDNDLIFAKIMSYLDFPDLKNSRLVSKRWNVGASDVLGKIWEITFSFETDYISPEKSTRVFHYLKEVEGLKPRNAHIILRTIDQDYNSPVPSLWQDPLLFSPGEPGDKMMNDLQKLLNSAHNFSNVVLTCGAIDESAARPFSLILKHLGGKLVELKLEDLTFLPEAMPPLPVMANLKQLIQDEMDELKIDQKCVSFLVPLFADSLEYFSFFYDVGKDQVDHYLQEFVKHEMPNLREIYIRCGRRKREISETSLSLLLQLRTLLTDLEIPYRKYRSEPANDEGWTLLEKLLLKNSSSLKHLKMEIRHDGSDKQVEIKFPPFPNLEELDLSYSAAPGKMRISWKSGDLDYKMHFPSLRSLRIVNGFRISERGYEDEDDPVFNSFFKEGGPVVGVVWVHLLAVKAEPRMDRIGETFPNAGFSIESGYEDEYPWNIINY